MAADGALSTISGPIPTGEPAARWLVASNDGRFAFAGSQTPIPATAAGLAGR